MSEPAPPRPMLTVVRGGPTAEQLAALVAVVTSRAAGSGEPPAPSEWAPPVLRSPLAHGPGAWRASCLPH